MNLFNESVYVVEGFDMVGKNFFVDKFMPEFSLYHANHDLTDETIGRHESWAIGYGVMDFLFQIQETSKIKVVIDRGVSSSFVYKALYEGNLDSNDHILTVVNWYSRNDFFKKSVGHIHVCHYNKASAKRLYEISQSREKNPNEVSAQMDRFSSFDEYWEYYTEAEDLFREVYRKIGITPIVVKSMPRSFVVEIPGEDPITVKVKE